MIKSPNIRKFALLALVTAILQPAFGKPSTHTLRAGGIEARWSTGGGEPMSLQLAEPGSKRALTLGHGFIPSLILADGSRLDLAPILETFRDDDDTVSSEAAIGSNPHGLAGRVKFSLSGDPGYLIQELTLTATRDLTIEEIVFLDTDLTGVEILGEVAGSVARHDDFFLAIEHPLATISTPENRALRCALPRGNTLKAGTTRSYSLVIGITPKDQFRRGFMRYLEQRRARPYRPFVHYNSWYHLNIARPGRRMFENECLQAIEQIRRELITTRNIRLDAFVWDDGWDDHDSLWDFHAGFPQGFENLHAETKNARAGMGVWMSPWGGYDPEKSARLAYGRAHGYETNARGFSMAGEKYATAFRDRCFAMMDDYGVNFFKFDGMGSGNMVSGASAEAAADIDAVLDLTTQLRQKNPEVFISATIGTWPSPFWLMYVDSIWRQAADTGFAGPGNDRERWITYRDTHTYRNIVSRAPCYPINSLMTGGIVIGEREDPARMPLDEFSVRNEIRAMIGSGTCLQELYIAPHLLTPQMWDALAESITWLRVRRAAFADIQWIGGTPGNLEIYGWAGWDGGTGVLTLRNPADHPQTFTISVIDVLRIPPDQSKPVYRLCSPYPDQRLTEIHWEQATPLHIQLQPFEVVSFEITSP